MSKAKHEIETALDEQIQSENKRSCVNALRVAKKAITDRQRWIAARKNQIEQLDGLTQKLFEAYNLADEAAVKETIRLINMVSTEGAKVKDLGDYLQNPTLSKDAWVEIALEC